MRILLLTPYLTIGGVDRFNLNLVRLLSGRGHVFTIVVTLPGAHEWRSLFEEVTPDIVCLSQTIPPDQQPSFICDLIHTRGIEAVIVANSHIGYLLLPYLRYHCPNVALLDIVHAVEEHWHDGGYPRISLEHAEWLDQTIAGYAGLRDWMIERGGDPARLAVCTANIDAGEWDAARYDRAVLRQSLGVAPDVALILFIGRLAPEKRPRLAVEVLRELARRGLPFKGLIVGDGPERQSLERQLRDSYASEVRLLGAVSETRQRELLASADILFMPSAREGIALVLYEAMAMGVTPVAADVGGQAELVTPDCGILIPPTASVTVAYADALTGLLNDPARRAAMGVSARHRIVTHFQLSQLGERMDRLIADTCRRNHDTPRPAASRDSAAQSAIRVIQAARYDRNVARLWRDGMIDGDQPDLSLAKRGVLAGIRAAKSIFRPLFRRFKTHDGHWIARVVLVIRDWLVRWIYRNTA